MRGTRVHVQGSQPISLCIFLPFPVLAPLPEFSVPICALSLRLLDQAPLTASLLSALVVHLRREFVSGRPERETRAK